MCLAIPAIVKKFDGANSVVTVGNIDIPASLELTPDCKTGDWVIVHAGYSIQKLDARSATERLEIFSSLYDEK